MLEEVKATGANKFLITMHDGIDGSDEKLNYGAKIWHYE